MTDPKAFYILSCISSNNAFTDEYAHSSRVALLVGELARLQIVSTISTIMNNCQNSPETHISIYSHVSLVMCWRHSLMISTRQTTYFEENYFTWEQQWNLKQPQSISSKDTYIFII